MISREGYLPIALLVALAAGLSAQGWWLGAVPVWALAGWCVVLFLDRRPNTPADPLGLLAPFDGEVLRVDSVEDPWRKRRALRVRIGVRVPGIGTVHAPTEGKVFGYWTSPLAFDAGGACVASSKQGSPNCYAVGIDTDEGDVVAFAISSVRPISRFRLERGPGERSGQGERVGFVYFASYVDVLVPRNTLITVRPGDAARAGETIIGTLVRD